MADIYQLLIDVKGLDKLAKVSQINKQLKASQKGVVGGFKQGDKATKGYLQQNVNLQRYMRDTGTGVSKLAGTQLALNKAYGLTAETLDVRTGKAIGATLVSQDGLSKVTLKTTKRFQDMSQIIGKVAVWAVATTAIYGTINALRKVWRWTQEYALAFARVSTVTRGTARDLYMISQSILGYASTSIRALGDITKATYHLGSAGFSVREQMAGLKPVMDLVIGTFGQIDQVARLVAGSYNLFGKSMTRLKSPAEKLRYISDTLAYYYSKEQVELSEIAGAMTLVGSAAGLLDIDYKTLIATIAELNTGMLRGCLSDDTEILTDQGWKLFTDLDKTEKVATLNSQTHQLEYQLPYEYINEPYQGKMYKIKNRHLDFLFTPNHWIYSRYGRKSCKTRKYKLRRADEVFGKEQTFIRGAKWTGKSPKYFILPSIEMHYGGYNHKSDKVKIKTKDWVQFLAWWLSEGSSSTYKLDSKATNYKVVIFQNEGKERDEIRELLERLPFKFYENNSNSKTPSFVINSKPLYMYLKQFGKSYEKYLPEFIKNLSSKLLKLFISTYNKGDGRKEIRGTTFEITTSSMKMRDDLEEIGLKAGYGVSHSLCNAKGSFNSNYLIWKIYINNLTEFSFWQEKNLKEDRGYNHTTIEEWQDYNGHQVCVEVPNHIIFIRRNGKTLWCGNTRAGTSLTNSMIKIARNADKLKQHFGVMFDPQEPLNFVSIMEQLHIATLGNAKSTDTLRKLMDVFGIRGARAVQSILNRFEDWQDSINATDDTFDNSAENMRYKVEYTLGGAFKKLGNIIKTNIVKTLEGDPGASWATQLFHRALDAQKGYKNLDKTLASLEPRMARLPRLSEEWKGSLKKSGEYLSWIGLGLEETGIMQHILSQNIKEGARSWQTQREVVRDFKEAVEDAVGAFDPDHPNRVKLAINELIYRTQWLTGISREHLKTLFESEKFMSYLEEEAKNLTISKEQESKAQDSLLESTAKQLRAVRQSAKYVMMEIRGYSQISVANEKILDSRKEILFQLEKSKTIVEGLQEAQTEGKKLSEAQLETLENRTVIEQLEKYLRGDIANLTEKELIAAQKVGLEKKNLLNLEKLINATIAERAKEEATIAEWIATTTEQNRTRFKLLVAQTNQAMAFGRAFPPLSEEMKNFVKEIPAVQKFLKQRFKVPISVMTAAKPYIAARRYYEEQGIPTMGDGRMKYIPSTLLEAREMAARRRHKLVAGLRIPLPVQPPPVINQINVTVDADKIIESTRTGVEQAMEQVKPELEKAFTGTKEEHDASTSATGR